MMVEGVGYHYGADIGFMYLLLQAHDRRDYTTAIGRLRAPQEERREDIDVQMSC
jgi:hypothetical protein